ncbi:hypothetical protein J1614_006799 [Plenodomus biglobosus]|nr:hypothetical protein J1614_006799 [Plenodomus biglobosus]
MSHFLNLPIPLPPGTLTPGQLISDPLSPTPSLHPRPPIPIPTTHSTPSAAPSTPKSQLHIPNPLATFTTLQQDSTTRSQLCNIAHQNKPVYLITGIQTVRRQLGKEHRDAETLPYRVPVRRVDSAANLKTTPSTSPSTTTATATTTNNANANANANTNTNSVNDPNRHPEEELITAIELREVKCRIGAPSEPHCISDVDYEWIYHWLDGEDMQLAVGLGKVVRAEDLVGSAGAERKEEEQGSVGRDWRVQEQGMREIEGLGGF